MSELIDLIGPAGLTIAMLAMFCGAAAQAAIGMGLNLFTVGILALINPVFVPGPVLVHSFLLSLAANILRRSLKRVARKVQHARSFFGVRSDDGL